MQLIEFELSHIELEKDGEVYDLHNNFDFVQFSYNVLARELKLEWKRSSGEWVPEDSPQAITIKIINVSYFSASPRDPEIPYTEDDCLNSVSFVNPNENTEYSFILRSPANNELHYVFEFMSGLVLRIQAETAECEIK